MQTAARAELFIIAAIAPALLFPTPARLIVLLTLPVLAVAARRVYGRIVPATPLNVALYLLLGMTAVSALVTFDLHNSLGKICGVILGALMFWALVRWVNSPQRLHVAISAFLAAGAALAAIGLLGTNWFGKFGPVASIINHLPKAIRGVPGAEEGFQPNAVAGCLVLFIPLQAGMLFDALRGRTTTHERRAVWYALLLGLTTATLVLTQSRGAWIGIAAAFGIFALWFRPVTRFAAIAAIVAAAAAALYIGPGRVASLAVRQSGPAMMQNVEGRGELWARALDAIADVPFTGLGMNNFRRLMPRMYPTVLSTPSLDIAHAHNHLLQAALDLGLPGLAAYLGLWIGAFMMLARVYRRANDALARTAAGGLAAGLIAHFVFGLADAIPLGAKVGVLFWLTLAMTTALYRMTMQRSPTA